MARTLRLGIAAISAASLIATARPALAQPAVQSEGPCSGTSTFFLEVRQRDVEHIRLEFDVDEGITGHRWQVKITDNGITIDREVKVTTGGGSFKVERYRPDLDGPDTVVATALNQATGETCTGQVTF